MFQTFLFIIELLWEHAEKKRFVLAIVTTTALWTTFFYTPLFLAKFINNLDNTDIAIKFLILFIIISLLGVLLKFVFRFYFEFLDEQIRLRFLSSYFSKLYFQDFTWHTNNSTGYIISVIKSVAHHLELFTIKILRKYIPALVGIFLFFIYSYQISIYLLLYFLIFSGFILFIIRKTYTSRMSLMDKAAIKWAKFDKVFLDFLYNINTLKKLFIRDYAVNKIEKSKNLMYKSDIKIYKMNALQWFVSDFLVLLMFLLPISYFVYMSIAWYASALEIVIVIYGVMWFFTDFIKEALEYMRHIAMWKADISLLMKKMWSEQVWEKKWKKIKNFQNILFDNTVYKYVKNNTSFTHKIPYLNIKKWEKIAIIGESWAWKTTFLNLLTKNISPLSWNICINSINYWDIWLDFFQKNLLYIAQNVELFDVSLKENILLGKKIDEQELLDILHDIWLGDFLKRISYNLDIDLWEKWIKISAWERQRINIVRGLILKRPIMILDEITGNLDIKTTKKVWDLIFKRCKESTIIVVSHEKQVLNYVKRTIVFKNWEMKEK